MSGSCWYNGGSLYIDDGRPTPAGSPRPCATCARSPTTFYVNVPKGFEALLPHLEREPDLLREPSSAGCA